MLFKLLVFHSFSSLTSLDVFLHSALKVLIWFQEINFKKSVKDLINLTFYNINVLLQCLLTQDVPRPFLFTNLFSRNILILNVNLKISHPKIICSDQSWNLSLRSILRPLFKLQILKSRFILILKLVIETNPKTSC